MSDDSTAEFEVRIIASMSGAMLAIAAGPMDALRIANAGGRIDAKSLASLSDQLRKLAHQASLTASLSAMLAKLKR